MKHWIAFAAILLSGIAAVVVSERRKADVPAGPAAVLYLVADTEQELTRLPVRFTRMSDQDEIGIGDQLAVGYLPEPDETGNADTREVERYLHLVGSRLATGAHRQLPYRFHFLPDRSLINAFALPGGQVFVGAGLLSLMDSEDELAAVLGHEIEHIDHYHCAERVQREEALRRIPLAGLVALPVTVFEAGYSKDQELEADREGTRLAVESGYSANGAIRMFETFERLYEEHQARAKTPQQELSNVAFQTLEGYFRSHPLASERMDQIRRLISSERWTARPEHDLAVGYIFWTDRAKEALAASKYQLAEQLATRSLRVRPGQENALRVLAPAQFAQANFAAAASGYRKLLDLDPSRVEIGDAYLYAQALAASDGSKASLEFERWEESLPGERPRDLQVPMAGLSLLAGNRLPARSASAAATASVDDSWAPDWLANLGWWYYRAGDFGTAQELLNDAVQQRPANARFTTELAWTQIENRKLADAIRTLTTTYDSSDSPDRLMAKAVSLWQTGQPTAALSQFEIAIARQPQWENERWVRALYSSRVAQSIQDMQAERLRQKKIRTAGRHGMASSNLRPA